MSDSIKTHYRACHLCEAICGLEIRTQGKEILSIKGDKKDPFSQGYICPKATAIADIHNDPDRLRKPMHRIGNEWAEIEWDDAIDIVASRLVEIQTRYSDDAVAFYAGNPGVHNYGNITHGSQLRKVLKTRNHFSATSLDQLPHHLAAYTMFGHQFFIPVPDVDRTQHMVIMGGNPLASNGSLMTMPNAPKRLKALQKRGGKLIVIDPRRTETAELADEHHFIRPGSDAWLLMAIIQTLFAENLIQDSGLLEVSDGLDEIKTAAKDFTPAVAATQTGISETIIKTFARELASTDKAVLYGRMGVSVQEFGALCQWAIQVINLLIGAVDQEGGAMLTSPAFASVRKGTPAAGHYNRFQSRVSGLPEFAGELPAAALAEEISTPGEGQIKALISIAGNPLISSVNSQQLENAFGELEFYVAFDFYINATTRHADIILPPTSPLEHDHYDIAFHRLAVRDTTRYNPAVFEPQENSMHDWQVFNAVTKRISEIRGLAYRPLPAPDVIVDMGIKEDIYGEQQNEEFSLSLDKIKSAPHGIDLGPLKSGIKDRIANESGRINLAPQIYLNDLPRLLASQQKDHSLLLIGRRHIRSNNSWMHNYHRLVKGPIRWQLMMHPDDLQVHGVKDGDNVTIESRVGKVTTTVLATDEVMPGVVSLPHGWGHQLEGVKMRIATEQKGVNCNILTDDKFIDKLSGNAALNGVPVSVTAA